MRIQANPILKHIKKKFVEIFTKNRTKSEYLEKEGNKNEKWGEK